MKKKQLDTTQQETLNSHVGLLRDLIDHPAWKLLEGELDLVLGKIKELLRVPCTDEEKRFTASHLLKERLTALYVLKNMPKMKLDELELMMVTEEDRLKPMQEKLEIFNKKLSNELKKYIKL